MAAWRYALYDLRTNALLMDHCPFSIDSYTTMLGEAGTCSATLPLDDPRIQARRPSEIILPARTALVILRDETVVWDGIIWTARPKRETKGASLAVEASEVRSYFDHRLLRPELGYGSAKTLSYTQVDQFDVVRAIVADAQTIVINGNTPGDIGIQVDSAMSGVLIDRRDAGDELGAYHGYEFTSHGQHLRDLAEGDPGMEYRIDSGLDESRQLRRFMRLGSPRVGSGADAAELATYEYPGSILTYEWPSDGERSANYVAALGEGDGNSLRWAQAINTAQLDAGWPLLEAATSHKDDSSLTILAGRAAADLAAMSGTKTVPTLDLAGYSDVVIGDYVRVRIRDEAVFPGSGSVPLEASVRVIGKRITPGGDEKTSLTIEEPRDIS